MQCVELLSFLFSAWHMQNTVKPLKPWQHIATPLVCFMTEKQQDFNQSRLFRHQMMVSLIQRDNSVCFRRQCPSMSIPLECLKLGRGCSRPKVSPSRSLHPPHTRNRSDVRSEVHQTSLRSDCQRRLLCLSVGEKSPAVQLKRWWK